MFKLPLLVAMRYPITKHAPACRARDNVAATDAVPSPQGCGEEASSSRLTLQLVTLREKRQAAERAGGWGQRVVGWAHEWGRGCQGGGGGVQ